MMVLRHAGPPSATVVSHEEMAQDEDRPPIPIDLSNKHSSSSSPEMPRHLAKNPFLSIIPTTIRPLLSPRTPPNNYLNNNNINTNNNVSKCNNSSSSPRSGESSPRVLEGRNKRKHGTYNESTTSEMRWSGGVLSTEDINSSPDSGLHRDSPGEDEDVAFGKDPTPPLAIRKQSQSLIPLSIIRARYSHKLRADVDQEPMVVMNEDEGGTGISPGSRPKDQVLTKRARLEEMVTHIKSSKDRSRRNSGDDDTSSGGHDVNSSDEVTEDGPTDLRSSSSSSLRARLINSCANGLNLKRVDENDEEDVTLNEEPCNLVCPKNNNYNINNNNNNNNNRSGMSRTEESTLEAWKNANKSPGSKQNLPFSPVEAAKVLGIEPDAYQQQMMQFQLQSAAMLGDPSGLLKAMGPYPPLVYLGYYSQLLHSFQAQEILRQYAMQSNPVNPNPGDKSPRTFSSTGYNCQSPLSPASLSEGPAGIDSDGSIVGQSTSGSANNGKRAPRAMTGRHVRTGTGASPATLQTLRQKIEERQRMKAQQAQNDLLNQPNSKIKNNKYLKKPSNKK